MGKVVPLVMFMITLLLVIIGNQFPNPLESEHKSEYSDVSSPLPTLRILFFIKSSEKIMLNEDKQQKTIELPFGKIEKDEESSTAVKRIISEECGNNPISEATFFDMKRDNDETVIIYSVTIEEECKLKENRVILTEEEIMQKKHSFKTEYDYLIIEKFWYKNKLTST
jgi:ADP-ribose pyrophosphatase YjhB (NUDIX family)